MSTIDRAKLQRELADARTENEIWRRKAATRQLQQQEAEAATRERRRKAAAQRAATRRKARELARQSILDASLAIAARTTPADPNAELHRHILINALKEHS